MRRHARRLRRLAIVATVLVATGLTIAALAGAQDSKGTDFWLAFPGNLGTSEISLFVTGDTATTGTVTIPGLAFTAPFTVTPGTVTTVALPSTAALQSSDTIEDKGVHVVALAEVTVYGLDRLQATTDAYLGLPTDALGTDYINIGYENVGVVNATQLGVVATQDNTDVTITPTETTNGHTANVPYTINLNQGQTYLLRNTDAAPADLTGTLITSTKPIAVFGGHQCANIPAGKVACDHIIEELPPTTAWGQNFVSMPLATRTGGDTFRILAAQDGTTVTLNGSNVATLNRGEFHEQIVNGPAQITANHPVLVMQYSNSSSFDGVTSDPFQMMIPPFEQFLASYTVSTPASGFSTNFINVVAPNAAVGSIVLDGSPIPAGSFTAIGGSGFSGAQVPVSLASHNLTGPLPFGVHSYGFASFDSYGYPGGLSLSEVASVTSLTLAPKTATNPVGSQHCVTAAVKDQHDAPLIDIRVDFLVTGANQTSGFDFTDQNGEAVFCYTGANPGTDAIAASVGTLVDTAQKFWGEGGPPPPPPPGSGGPPPPITDLSITKSDSPDPVTLGGDVTYTLTARNAGPDRATGVLVGDALPPASTFVSATATQGSCGVAFAIVTCTLGTLNVGSSASVTIVLRPTAAGFLDNFARIVGALPESSLANNAAFTRTIVESPAAPLTPPTTCASMRLSPRQLTVGKKTTVSARVRGSDGQPFAGAKVRFRGPGIAAIRETNGDGIARLNVKAKRHGILRVTVLGSESARCSVRSGILGVFKPSLTG